MKLSTAIRKAAKTIYLSPMGDQWQIIRHHDDYTTSSNSFLYAQARAYRKEAVAEEALLLMGLDEEAAMMASFVCQEGAAQEVAQRVLNKIS